MLPLRKPSDEEIIKALLAYQKGDEPDDLTDRDIWIAREFLSE